MSFKIKTHVLSKRLGSELGEPMVFAGYEQAYKEMEEQFNNALGEYTWYSKDESGLYGDNALIVTKDDWEEWKITECELELNDLRDFASVFEKFLGDYSKKFEQFMSKSSETMDMAAALAVNLIELKKLLAAALPEKGENADE